jgi:hypothetical protein
MNATHLTILTRALLLISGALLSTGATIYRWVDADGVVHFAQQPPREAGRSDSFDTRDMVTNVVGTVEAESEAATEAPAPARNPLEQLEREEQARREEVSKVMAENCERARGVLERLQTRGRVRVRDENGEERVLGEDERQQRIAEAQAGVASNCVS